MSDEFGFSSEVREAVEAAKAAAPVRYVIDPRTQHRRTHWRTNRETGEIEEYLEEIDPVPDAVRGSIANTLLGGVPITCPFADGSDDAQRFWSGVEAWRSR